MTVMQELNQKSCTPCEGNEKPLDQEQISKLLKDVDGWAAAKEYTQIVRDLEMDDFMDAVGLITEVAKVAEIEGHHPDIHLTGYKNVKIELSTHAIGGLSENDFILAAKINHILEGAE